ncbi:MAG: hypothetical protein NTX63_05095, partial [Candidatus Peregrinibacteria bacterium]|nr:hypothetical protein [Candidatus Peregrinibacteria bacterium]
MKNTQTVSTSFSPKKIALLVTGLLAVVVLGIFLGRGNLFKGSFIGSESATIPVPTNVKITQNAAKKFILSWDYDKDAEAKSFLTYTNAAGVKIPAVAFGWVIQDATTGTVVGSDDVLNDTSSNPGSICNIKLADDGMRETVDGYVCHDVVLNDTIAAELAKGKGNILKVRAYTGVTALTDPADPQLYVRQLSMAGLGEYMLQLAPAVVAPALLDVLNVTLPAKEGDLVTFTYGWSDKTIVPSATNTTYRDGRDNYQFVYNSMLLDDANNVVWNNDKGTSPTLTPLAPGYESCLTTINGNLSWICQMGYIPSGVTLT